MRLALFLPVALFVVLSVVLLLGLDSDPTELPSALVDEPCLLYTSPSPRDS